MATKSTKRIPKLTEKVIAATKMLVPQTRRPRKKKPEQFVLPETMAPKMAEKHTPNTAEEQTQKSDEKNIPNRVEKRTPNTAEKHTQKQTQKLDEKHTLKPVEKHSQYVAEKHIQIKAERNVQAEKQKLAGIEKQNSAEKHSLISVEKQREKHIQIKQLQSQKHAEKVTKALSCILERKKQKDKPIPALEIAKKKDRVEKILLKSLPLLENKKVKPKKIKEKSKTQSEDCTEFYPEKLKRNVPAKRIVLKPQPNFVIVAATNKRKRCTPHRGPDLQAIKKPKSLKENYRESIRSSQDLSQEMMDISQLMDEDLSEEDLLEILTCPSPVWWENLDENSSSDDAVFSRLEQAKNYQKNIDKGKTITNVEEDKIMNKSIQGIMNNQFKKRQALELVLNKIKNTGNTAQINKINNSVDGNDSTKQTISSKPPDREFVFNTGNTESNSDNFDSSATSGKITVSNSVNNSDNFDHISISNSENSGRISVSESEDYLDNSLNEDEILHSLENINIPVEKSQNIEILDEDVESVEIDKVIERNSKIIKVPDKMPPLTRRPDIKNKTPVIFDEDIISDSNIQFISDDEDSLGESNSVKQLNPFVNDNLASNVNKQGIFKNGDRDVISVFNRSDENNTIEFFHNKKKKSDMSDFVTVYKIIPESCNNNIEINEFDKQSENKNKMEVGKINDFFKKCKKNKPPKKCTNSAFSILHTKEIKNHSVNSDVTPSIEEDNRLNRCDCLQKTVNEPCKKCTFPPILENSSLPSYEISSVSKSLQIANNENNLVLNPLSSCLNQT